MSLTAREAITLSTTSESGRHGSSQGLNSLLSTAIFWGLVAGFGEGLGLLFFQRINWAQWARVMHVSKEILWISPVVVVIFFVAIAVLLALISLIVTRLPAIRVLTFALVLLTAYDWLMVSGHFFRPAALVFGVGAAIAFDRWFRRREPQAARAWRRYAPWLAACWILTFVAIEGGKRLSEWHTLSQLPAATPGSPNVLVIVVDTLRADHLSSYRYSRQTSPNLDLLAHKGTLFENAVAPSSWSLPSHASLVTGRAVHEHGLGNVQPMPWFGWGHSAMNGLPTLGEVLQKHGYRTGAFSANRIYFTSNVGLGRGFMHFEDYFDGVGDAFVRTQFGREFARLYMNRSEKSKFTRMFRALGLGSWLDKDSEGSGDYGGIYGIRKRANEVNRETLRWIASDRQHPFFAFLNYLDVHYGYGGPKDYAKPDWDRGSTIDEYDAGIKYTDDYIGRLLGELDGLDVLKNTVVIVTSDHGESLGDHGLSFHGAALYWELVHVPLIIAWPGHIPEGVKVQQPVSNAAIASTILDLIGGNVNSFPGPSLQDVWKQHGSESWPNVISELPQTNTIVAADRAMQGKIPIATDGWMKSVVSPQWQLIVHEKLGNQLYDWKADPKESMDLANTPEGQAAIPVLAQPISKY